MQVPDNPVATVLEQAAKGMRDVARAVPQGAWEGLPWAVEECSDPERGECPCIVYQGEYKPWDESQVPAIRYVADAETPEHAAYIAACHPGFLVTVASWLEAGAASARATMSRDIAECAHEEQCRYERLPGWFCDVCGNPCPQECRCHDEALAVARTWPAMAASHREGHEERAR